MTKVAPLWALLIFITQTGSVRSDMVFLQRNEGDSVLLPCAVEPRESPPFGVYLKRHWLRPREVLFKHVGHEHTVDNGEDKGRIKVSGDANLHALNVTISQLSAADTDRYVCEFIVATVSSEDERRPGSSEFFLLVTAGGQCGCSNYSTLLYALSSAVVILVLLLALLFVVFYKGKARSSSTLKSHPQAPHLRGDDRVAGFRSKTATPASGGTGFI